MKNIVGLSVALLFTVNGKSLQAGLGESRDERCFEEKAITLYEVKEKAKFKAGGVVHSSPAIAKDGTVVVGSYGK